jgi:hypothetical protein
MTSKWASTNRRTPTRQHLPRRKAGANAVDLPLSGEVWSLRPAAEPYAITLAQERGEGATESAAPLFITLTGHALTRAEHSKLLRRDARLPPAVLVTP